MINIYTNQTNECVNSLDYRVAMVLVNNMTSEWSVMLVDDYFDANNRMNTFIVNHNESLPINKWNESINGVFDINLEDGQYGVYNVNAQGYLDVNDPAFQAYINLHVMNIENELSIRNQKYYKATLQYLPSTMVVSSEKNQFLIYAN